MRALAAGLGLGFLAACASAPPPRPLVFTPGEPVPLMGEVDLLEAPAPKLDLDALGGQVVVLELWATWCVPCVEALPHLNELAERFTDRGVTFVSVTDQPREEIVRFLEKHPIRGWIGLHRGELPLARLGLRGLPVTALVGKDGRLLGLTHPENLKAEHLEAALRGERPELPGIPVGRSRTLSAGGDPADILYWVRLERFSEGMAAGLQPIDGGFAIRGSTFEDMLSIAYQTPPAGMRIQAELPPGSWTLEVRAPGAGKDFNLTLDLMRGALLKAAELEASRVTVEAEVQVLGVADPVRLQGCRFEGPRGSASLGPDGLRARGQPLSSLARMLERALGRPVVDETGETERFELDLPFAWNPAEPPSAEALDAVLREKAGLKLEPARRAIELLVLSPRPARQARQE
jgi:uncharacterized protein (TIGR03435 family)